MYVSETYIRVRYGETDQMGYVYYGNYAMYYEVARVESLRRLGLTYKELEAMGVMMPVLENHSKFLSAALYDDNLRIVTTIREKPGVRIKFEYTIFNSCFHIVSCSRNNSTIQQLTTSPISPKNIPLTKAFQPVLRS